MKISTCSEMLQADRHNIFFCFEAPICGATAQPAPLEFMSPPGRAEGEQLNSDIRLERLVNLADSVREIVAFAVVRHERQNFFESFFTPKGLLGQPCRFAVAFLMGPPCINCLKRVSQLHVVIHA